MNSSHKILLEIKQWHKDASRSENQVEQKLLSLSKVVSGSNNSSVHTFQSLEREIEEMLNELSTSLQVRRQALLSWQHDDPEQLVSRLSLQVEQHAQVIQNLSNEFRTLRSQGRRNLLISDEEDSSHVSDTASSRVSRIVQDRDHIVNINAMTNQLVDRANTIRGEIHTQRNLINGAEIKLGGLRARFPVVDALVGRIQQKRQKDMVILSFFIAACIIITFFLL